MVGRPMDGDGSVVPKAVPLAVQLLVVGIALGPQLAGQPAAQWPVGWMGAIHCLAPCRPSCLGSGGLALVAGRVWVGSQVIEGWALGFRLGFHLVRTAVVGGPKVQYIRSETGLQQECTYRRDREGIRSGSKGARRA